jgi:hypothetical protein
MDAPIPRICIENPVSVISTRIRKPDQIIQPWQFGHPESKATCLWLLGLPLLQPTNVLPKPATGRWSNQTPTGQNNLGPSADRWKERSKTYSGIAEAMAQQWGNQAAWIPCPNCDEYWCTIHSEHAWSCPCPPIEQWTINPYEAAS